MNDSVDTVAERLFSIPYNELDPKNNRFIIEMQDDAELYDMFLMFLEIILYGINRLTNGVSKIFDMTDDGDDMIYILNRYLILLGIRVNVVEIVTDTINDYRKRSDIYCELFEPPPFSIFKENLIQGYKLRINTLYEYKKSPGSSTKLKDMYGLFLNKKGKLFRFSFEFVRQ